MRRLRNALIAIGVFGCLLVLGLHLLLTYRAKDIVQTLVVELSDGKYHAKLGEVKVTYFPAGITIKKIGLQPIREDQQSTTVTADFIHLKISSLLDFAFNKRLHVQLLHIIKPSITAYAKEKKAVQKKDISQTISDIQQALFNTFEALDVKNSTIENAAIKIYASPYDGSYFGINHISIALNNIDFAKATENAASQLSGMALIELKKPDIHLIDSSLKAYVGYMQVNSSSGNISIDSLHFSRINSFKRPANVWFSQIRIKDLNWPRFLKEGLLELDSVMVARGNASLSFLDKPGTIKPDSAIKKKYMGTSLIIHYASVLGIKYSLETKDFLNKKSNQMLMDLNGDSLLINELSLINNRKPALSIEDLKLRITNFSENDKSNNYSFSLGDLAITNKTLVLKDYQLKANKGSKYGLDNKIVIPEIRLENYSFEDLLQKRLIASAITVVNPELVIDILNKPQSQKEQKKDINKTIDLAMQSLAKKLSINNVAIQNASIRLLPEAASNNEIKLAGLSVEINGQKVVRANSVMDIIQSINTFTTSGFTITGPNINLQVQNLKLLNEPRGLYFGSVKGQFGEDAYVDLKGVTLLNANNTLDLTNATGLYASNLTVESGSITVQKKSTPGAASFKKNTTPLIRTNHLHLQHIQFNIEEDEKLLASASLNVEATDFMLADKHASWSKLDISSTGNKADLGSTSFNAGNLKVLQPGIIELEKASGTMQNENVTVKFEADKLQIGIGISSTNIPKLEVKRLYLQRPSLTIEMRRKVLSEPTIIKESKVLTKQVSLDHLELEDASFKLTYYDEAGKQLHAASSLEGKLTCENFSLSNRNNEAALAFQYATYHAQNLRTEIAKNLFHPASIHLSLKDAVYFPLSKKYSFQIDSFLLKDISHTIIGQKDDTLSFHLSKISVADLRFSSADSINWKEMLLNNKWWGNASFLRYHTPRQKIFVANFAANRVNEIEFSFDSVSMMPRLSREAFWLQEPFEKDYLQLQLGKTYGAHLQIDFTKATPSFMLKSMQVENLHLRTQRDKTKLEDTVSYRPLLARQISYLPFHFQVDSIALQNARIDYHEIVQKTGKESVLFFDQINGCMLQAKTINIEENDSLVMRLNARLYGQGFLKLRFRQSYSDSLQGFWMSTRMSGFNMKEMNALLLPTMGLNIRSGRIDTMTMLVNGNSRFAFGTMDIRYRNLKVKLLRNTSEEKYFLSGTINWLANLIVPNNDNGKANLIFKERVKKRGQFNFWGKIAVEGLLTNIGIKQDKKEEKKFKKNIERYQLPENYWQED